MSDETPVISKNELYQLIREDKVEEFNQRRKPGSKSVSSRSTPTRAKSKPGSAGATTTST